MSDESALTEILDLAKKHRVRITTDAAKVITNRAKGNLDNAIALFYVANRYATVHSREAITEYVVLQALREVGSQLVFNRESPNSLLDNIAAESDLEPDRTGLLFERKCLYLLQQRGFEVQATSRTSDGGIDLVAISNDPIVGGKYVVQCKDWSASVGVHIIRDLYGAVHHEDANKGILITRSSFTIEAIKFATGKRLELIDGSRLKQLILESQDNRVV